MTYACHIQQQVTQTPSGQDSSYPAHGRARRERNDIGNYQGGSPLLLHKYLAHATPGGLADGGRVLELNGGGTPAAVVARSLAPTRANGVPFSSNALFSSKVQGTPVPGTEQNSRTADNLLRARLRETNQLYTVAAVHAKREKQSHRSSPSDQPNPPSATGTCR